MSRNACVESASIVLGTRDVENGLRNGEWGAGIARTAAAKLNFYLLVSKGPVTLLKRYAHELVPCSTGCRPPVGGIP
jgi:hypothetical protein